MSTYEGDWSSLIGAAVTVSIADPSTVDADVRAAANDLLRTEFKAATMTGGGPNDDPAQTDVGEEPDDE